MGSGRFDPGDWKGYAARTTATPDHKLFTTTDHIEEALDPRHIALRESRDSEANPNSTPLIVACDVTGSMGVLAKTLVRHGIGVLFAEVLKRAPITDPHLMAMAIGDVECDRAPLQVTQFETEASVIGAQMEKIWLEGNGGGNQHESYHLPWYFAATRTAIDSMQKRKTKGFLFTVGDELPPLPLLPAEVARVFGPATVTEGPLAIEDVLAMAERSWEVFHVVVEEGDFASRFGPRKVFERWNAILPQRVIALADHTKLAEVVVSAIEVTAGRAPDTVVKSWSGETSLVVAKAVSALAPGRATTAAAAVTRL